jgi:hypothetical protein
VVEGAGLAWDPKAAPPRATANTYVDCTMDVSEEHRGGSCGLLWDELPIFTLTRAIGITSGVWRRDASPSHVWAGKMADAESPVNYESRHGVEAVSHRKSSDQLIDFNNDSTARRTRTSLPTCNAAAAIFRRIVLGRRGLLLACLALLHTTSNCDPECVKVELTSCGYMAQHVPQRRKTRWNPEALCETFG